jgi:hypothetical protein
MRFIVSLPYLQRVLRPLRAGLLTDDSKLGYGGKLIYS